VGYVAATDHEPERHVVVYTFDHLSRRGNKAARRRFDPKLRLLGEPDHAAHRISIRDHEDLLDELSDVLEGELGDVRRAERARGRTRRDRDRFAGG